MIKHRSSTRILAVLLAAVMLLCSAPMSGLAGLDFGTVTASAASTTKSGTFQKLSHGPITHSLASSQSAARAQFPIMNTVTILILTLPLTLRGKSISRFHLKLNQA